MLAARLSDGEVLSGAAWGEWPSLLQGAELVRAGLGLGRGSQGEGRCAQDGKELERICNASVPG